MSASIATPKMVAAGTDTDKQANLTDRHLMRML